MWNLKASAIASLRGSEADEAIHNLNKPKNLQWNRKKRDSILWIATKHCVFLAMTKNLPLRHCEEQRDEAIHTKPRNDKVRILTPKLPAIPRFH